MEHVDVYRIEKRGRGPFQYYSSEVDPRLYSSINCEHPTPYYDGGIDRNWLDKVNIKDYRFGAPCPNSLKEWIKKPEVLQQLGFKVSLYKVKKNHVKSSSIQSMFIKRHAKKVLEWDVETFMKEEFMEYEM